MNVINNNDCTLKELIDFFNNKDTLNTLKEVFGKENISQFINLDDRICLQFKKFEFPFL